MNEGTKYLETGTSLSGYEASGPYYCGDCVHLAPASNRTARTGVCEHPIVALDTKLEHPGKDSTTVNLARGCCRFVRVSEPAHPLSAALRGKIS